MVIGMAVAAQIVLGDGGANFPTPNWDLITDNYFKQ